MEVKWLIHTEYLMNNCFARPNTISHQIRSQGLDMPRVGMNSNKYKSQVYNFVSW